MVKLNIKKSNVQYYKRLQCLAIIHAITVDISLYGLVMIPTVNAIIVATTAHHAWAQPSATV